MSKYTLSFVVSTECDPGTLLDKLEQICEDFTDNDYGEDCEPVDGSASVAPYPLVPRAPWRP